MREEKEFHKQIRYSKHPDLNRISEIIEIQPKFEDGGRIIKTIEAINKSYTYLRDYLKGGL